MYIRLLLHESYKLQLGKEFFTNNQIKYKDKEGKEQTQLEPVKYRWFSWCN